MTSKDHVEDAALVAYDRYAPSVSEVTADRCALAFREGFLAGHTEAEDELRAEIERLKTDLHFQCRGMVADRDEQIEDLQAEIKRLRATTVFVVDVDPVGVVGVFTTLEAASAYFDELQVDDSLDLPIGIVEEFRLDVRDPDGFLVMRRRELARAKER